MDGLSIKHPTYLPQQDYNSSNLPLELTHPNAGENKGLALIVRPYTPRVQCAAPHGQPQHLTPGSCASILSQLRPTPTPIDFAAAPPIPGAPYKHELLPHQIVAPYQTACMGLIVTQDRAHYISSGFEMWAAAYAIDNLCVRNGKTGFAKIIREYSYQPTLPPVPPRPQPCRWVYSPRKREDELN